jgi:hypothetical protein
MLLRLFRLPNYRFLYLKAERLDSELISIAQRALDCTGQIPDRDRIATSKSNINEVVQRGVGRRDIVFKGSRIPRVRSVINL